MGAQKKGGFGAKQKPKGQFKPTPQKNMFEAEDDDDFSDSGSDAESSEEMPMTKTPNKNAPTPKQNSSMKKKDMHVSFQLQGNTPQQKQQMQKTPKGKKGTPMPIQKGQSALKEFSGMKNNFGAKVEKFTPPNKGKLFDQKPAKGSLAKKVQKAQEENESEDDEDDFNDDDMEDDSDMDDDEQEGDDDDDDDDNEDDEDDEQIRQELLAMKGGKKQNQQLEQKKTPQKNNQQLEQRIKKEESESPKVKNSRTPNKQAQTPNTQSPKSALKKPVPDSTNLPSETLDMEAERRRDRDRRNLYVRGLPSDVTVEELKALSPDIIDVSIPKAKMVQRNKKIKHFFAFLQFASEKKAEENFKILKQKKLRGQEIFVDFSGEKSQNKAIASKRTLEAQKIYNKKKLFVSGLTTETTIDQIAKLFPAAMSIHINVTFNYRNAVVEFRTEEEAAKDFSASSKPVVNGRLLTVLYHVEAVKKKRSKKRKNLDVPAGSNQQAKKMKMNNKPQQPSIKAAPEEDSDDDDDDDDDDSDE